MCFLDFLPSSWEKDYIVGMNKSRVECRISRWLEIQTQTLEKVQKNFQWDEHQHEPKGCPGLSKVVLPFIFPSHLCILSVLCLQEVTNGPYFRKKIFSFHMAITESQFQTEISHVPVRPLKSDLWLKQYLVFPWLIHPSF